MSLNIYTREYRDRFREFGRLIADALAGKEYDYTSGSIRKAVILLAIPMVLEMTMESVFAITDIFFVSSLGPEAVATVGLTEAVITLLYAIAVGFSMGVTAMVSRRIGENDHDGAAVVTGQAIWIGLVCSVLVGLTGLHFATEILEMMGAEDGVVAGGSTYTSIMLGGSITILFLFLLNAVFRGAGNATIAMRSLWLANGINIVLDPCLIFGLGPFPEMGVTGAAIATNIGRGTGVLYQLYHLFGGTTRVKFTFDYLALDPRVLWRLLRVSIGGVLQFLIATASFVALMRIVSAYGSIAIAGYTIAIRVIDLTFLPAWGMSNAAATLVGQNLGAGKPDRAEQCVWQTTKYNTVFLVTVAGIFILFAETIIYWFSNDPVINAYGSDCLRIISYGYGLFAAGMVLTQAFNGAGDTDTPTCINLFCFWLVQIPLAWLLANNIGLGPRGVFIAITVAESLVAVVACWQFCRGQWKLKVV